MFEGSLVESSALLRTRNRWPVVASLTAQIAAALLVVAIPLLHPGLLPTSLSRVALAVPVPRPVPPVPPVHILPRSTSHDLAAGAPAPPSTPVALTTTLLHSDAPLVDAGPISLVGLGPRIPGLPGALLSSVPAGPAVGVRASLPSPAKAATPLRISSGVSAGLLLSPIRPQYPPIARAAHQGGTVVITAIITASGRIESAHVMSGPMLLQAAALAAVYAARYHPYSLNGQPTPVETTISINFRLDN